MMEDSFDSRDEVIIINEREVRFDFCIGNFNVYSSNLIFSFDLFPAFELFFVFKRHLLKCYERNMEIDRLTNRLSHRKVILLIIFSFAIYFFI